MYGKKLLSIETMLLLEKKKKVFFEENKINEEDMISSMVKILREVFGFTVKSMKLPKSVDGAILVDSNGKYTRNQEPIKIIAVSSELSKYKQRFTVAHEFAHYILADNKGIVAYRDHSISNSFDNKENSDIENKADYLAASILMPKDMFSMDVKKLEHEDEIDKYMRLKDKYQVDFQTIIYREQEVKELDGIET